MRRQTNASEQLRRHVTSIDADTMLQSELAEALLALHDTDIINLTQGIEEVRDNVDAGISAVHARLNRIEHETKWMKIYLQAGLFFMAIIIVILLFTNYG